VMVRVHAVDPAADLLGIGASGGHPTLLARSMEMIAAEGRGVVVLIRDLRPKAVSQWIDAQNTTKNAAKSSSAAPVMQLRPGRERRQVEIGIGSQILRDLGVRDMTLLSNSAAQSYVGLESYGLKIVDVKKIG
jgi:3,4-dihydroxy 2-butanone 4-phosphate synthase / GTP cyclohydrolase II